MTVTDGVFSKEVHMVKVLLPVLLVLCCATPAFAKPRRVYNNSTPAYSAPVEARMMHTTTQNAGGTSTAQGVAEMQARSGSCQHFGGNSG
jgi:hypothetical protein